MYIKSIKAHGFKSFADKLELDFSSGINAIVGPNGSGKSNVVDAILWVLGEQSVKSLRGDSAMSDVIFSGSKTREEHRKASVAILFDNTDHSMATDLTEVEIKRVIYKTGENEYFINNARVRLKDITDLLIDVTSKFNIITQGNIAGLVENKSSERRTLFESAAGVLKYKKRKEESLKKLEGTKENLTRVNLIIKELETTLEPLAKQKDDATKFLEIKQNLEKIEIALIARDISSLTEEYNKLKNENTLLAKELESMQLAHPMGLEKLKLENIKVDEEITKINRLLLDLSSEIADLNSQKQINVERAKLKVDKSAVDANLLALNEEKLSLERNTHVLEEELKTLKEALTGIIKEHSKCADEEIKLKVKISNSNLEANKLTKEIMVLENKYNIEKANIEAGSFLPKSVSSVLNNPRLKGIHNTIGGVIKINEAHEIAINTALGASANFIIVDNFKCAGEAINYLKENKLGRATFFPLDTIKSRKLPEDVIEGFKTLSGFIGIASDLVSYDKRYTDIIENQLGNVLVVESLGDLNKISKKLEYKYKMVTLEGEISFPGGAVSGGAGQNYSSNKNALNSLKKQLDDTRLALDNLNITLKADNLNLDSYNNKITEFSKEITQKRVLIESKEGSLKELQDKLEEVKNNIQGFSDLDNNKLDETITEILEKLNNKLKEKEISENSLKDFQSKKFDLNAKIQDLEKEIQEQNSSYHKLQSKLSSNEVEIGKYEVKIDNLLQTLSEDYNLTYEYASDNYSLDIDAEIARHTVAKYKNELKGLHDVNIGSISEYDRLKKRFDFLDRQRNDLEVSSQELLNIIAEMDEVMKEKFKSTFESIAAEFTKVFRIMFKGGNGLLKLADENDLLNTGINILAVPPGKKLNSTAFLSGGEKSLTAICLIFAILNVKPTPFIVLDEAEAALDEENVNMFGEYLENMKSQSQFILITHKKKMMEYADCLYGVTMQESGVSKLVSVKLEGKEI